MILAALLTAALTQTVSSLEPIGGAEPAPAAVGAAAALSTDAPPLDPFTPESMLTMPGGMRIVRLPARGSPVLAMRVSVLIDESLNEAGAGRLLAIFGVQRVQGRAAVLGLQFEGTRTPWGITYTVSGSRTELAEMAALLQEAVSEPAVPDLEFERQRRVLWEDVLRTTETPASRIVAELRARAAPGAAALDGTPTTLERMTRVTLHDVWARTHRPTTMSVVVAGDVSDADLREAFRQLGPSSGSAFNRSSGPLQGSAGRATQVYRHWYGQAFRVSNPSDPHGAVVALLAADRLRASSEPFEAEVQLLELENVQLITVLAAAYPPNATAMRQRMTALLPETRQSLSSGSVRSAVARVRQEVLQEARTPAGLVSVVGRYLDATGDAGSARRFLTALSNVTIESTRAYIAQLEAQPPLRAEVRP